MDKIIVKGARENNLKNVDIELPKNKLVAVVGESGRGKTTLMRLISGIDTDFSGEINGGGKDTTSLAFQEKRLFPNLSALNNVLEISFSSYSTDDRSCVLEKFRQLGLI